MKSCCRRSNRLPAAGQTANASPAILDGSDKTNLSETAPTEKNFNSAGQPDTPADPTPSRPPSPPVPRKGSSYTSDQAVTHSRLWGAVPTGGAHGSAAQGGRSTVDRDHAGGPPPVHGTDGPDRPGGRSDGTAVARHGSARLQNRRRRARSPATTIGGAGSDGGRGKGRRRRPKATASAWREAAQTRERGRGRRGGSSPASMAAGAEDEGGGDDLAMRRGGRAAAAPTEGVEKD
uniref:Uncharacterized protein n=1 Tax=Oryza sativa subsp. japonica TaxID=39947 RepID=Q9AYG8_ORYSJ|nr:Hypothetical protein [Oryza sativa Japonica Group]